MKVHSLVVSHLTMAGLLVGIAVLLMARTAKAEPDRLVRTMLGVSSIPVRFAPPGDKNCCYLAIAKFKDGKFLGYAEMLAPVEEFLANAERPVYEAELGWAEKEHKFGFFLTTPGGTQGFKADEFFRGLASTHYLALGRVPTQTLGPFWVLGFGAGAPVEGAEPGNVRDVIRGKFGVAVFLIAPFETAEEAREFGKALPRLSTD